MMECQRQQQSPFLQQVNGGNGLHPRLFNPHHHHHHHSSVFGSFPRLPSAQNNVRDQEVPLLIRKIHFKLVAKALVFIKHSRICKHVEAFDYRKTLKTEIILHKSRIYNLLMIEVLRQHV